MSALKALVYILKINYYSSCNRASYYFIIFEPWPWLVPVAVAEELLVTELVEVPVPEEVDVAVDVPLDVAVAVRVAVDVAVVR